jgi:hypothetical protein
VRASQKIGLGVLVLVAGGYWGYQAFAHFQIDRIKFEQLSPGHVNLLGVQTKEGFKITVSNEIAQLIQLDKAEDFSGTVSGASTGDSSSEKRRVPLKETLETLMLNVEAAGSLVRGMNESLRSLELPPVEVLWDAKEIRKALDGDKELQAKLEADLNVKLDGTPLDKIRPSSLANSIVVQAYVPIQVPYQGRLETIKAPIKRPFVPRFVASVNKHLAVRFNPSREYIAGRYLEEANKLRERPGDRQDVRRVLEDLIDEERNEKLFADAPNQILSNALIVVNDSLMTGARVEEREQSGKTVADIRIHLTDEGRKRMWQYSRKNRGSQLLVIGENGIAIAAPRIESEITTGEVIINSVPNPSLAAELVETIKSYTKK